MKPFFVYSGTGKLLAQCSCWESVEIAVQFLRLTDGRRYLYITERAP